jgi:hypothetical protein
MGCFATITATNNFISCAVITSLQALHTSSTERTHFSEAGKRLASQASPFSDSRRSLQCSQKPTTGSYPEPSLVSSFQVFRLKFCTLFLISPKLAGETDIQLT